MKTILIIFSITFGVVLWSSSTITPREARNKIKTARATDTSGMINITKEKRSVQSVWLNKKYFPQLPESGIPVFVKPGC